MNEKEVKGTMRVVVPSGLHDVRLDLLLPAGATANEHSFMPVLGPVALDNELVEIVKPGITLAVP
jgi:hypothetical protein